jgi:hypothetical protein
MNTASGFAFLVLIFVAPMWIATTVNLGVISIEPTKTCSERSVKKNPMFGYYQTLTKKTLGNLGYDN